MDYNKYALLLGIGVIFALSLWFLERPKRKAPALRRDTDPALGDYKSITARD